MVNKRFSKIFTNKKRYMAYRISHHQLRWRCVVFKVIHPLQACIDVIFSAHSCPADDTISTDAERRAVPLR